MKGISEAIIALIIAVIGIALAIIFISLYLHKGGNFANSLWGSIPNFG